LYSYSINNFTKGLIYLCDSSLGKYFKKHGFNVSDDNIKDNLLDSLLTIEKSGPPTAILKLLGNHIVEKQDITFKLYFRHNLYYLESAKTVEIVKIYNLIYNEAHIFLMRKYVKGHLFLETLREKFPKFKEGVASPNPEPSYNNNNYLINKNNGQFIMEGAETIIGLLNLELGMEKG
jgi:hypothetical protein